MKSNSNMLDYQSEPDQNIAAETTFLRSEHSVEH